MTSPIDLVADWHSKFGVALPTTPTFDPAVCKLRIALLEEELAEYQAAEKAGNRVEMLDALCDLQYVLSGAVLHLGLRESDISFWVSHFEWSHFEEALDCFRIACRKEFSMNAMESIKAMQQILDNQIRDDGFESVFEAAFLAVHENNCGKVWTSEEADDCALEYQFESCLWNPTRWIARNLAGKVIKPPGHKKVDLTPFVK